MASTRGGARPGPKGPHTPRWSLRQTMDELRRGLAESPARATVGAARAALVHLEAQEAQEAELYCLRDECALYEQWRASYDPIWDAAREAGIEVYQPFGSDAWHWKRGEARGQAPTPGEALLQALAAR